MDPLCRSVRMNRAFTALLDAANLSLQGEPGSLARPYRYMRAGRELQSDKLPIRVAIKTMSRVPECDLDLVFDDDGHAVHLIGSAAPLFDENGEVTGALASFVDMTGIARTRGQERALSTRLGILAHLSLSLAELPDSRAILKTMSRQMVSRLCDAVFVLTLGDDGLPELAFVHHADAAASRRLQELWDSLQLQGPRYH